MSLSLKPIEVFCMGALTVEILNDYQNKNSDILKCAEPNLLLCSKPHWDADYHSTAQQCKQFCRLFQTPGPHFLHHLKRLKLQEHWDCAKRGVFVSEQQEWVDAPNGSEISVKHVSIINKDAPLLCFTCVSVASKLSFFTSALFSIRFAAEKALRKKLNLPFTVKKNIN